MLASRPFSAAGKTLLAPRLCGQACRAFFREDGSRLQQLVQSHVRDKYPLYVGGEAVWPSHFLPVVDKYTLKTAAHVGLADKDHMATAIAKAHESFPAMGALPNFERKAILSNVAKEIAARANELAVILAVEVGKPIADARVEVQRAATTFELAGEEAIRQTGEYAALDVSPRNKGYSGITRRFPIGPIAMISPFNFPLNLAAHKIAPAIAVGCPFVLKPSDRTPISSAVLGQILAKQTALPKGAFSILPCEIDVANMMTTDDRLKMLSFTGSPAVGWMLKARAAKKKVALELGGNAACVVDAGVDIEAAAARITFGAFYQSGQSCISVQRVFAHASVYDDLRSRLAKKAAALKIGDPLEDDTFIGPMISPEECLRVDTWVRDAVSKGGRVVEGSGADGPYFRPTILENVPANAILQTREVFGPVMYLEKFTDFKEAIARVNNSTFGLQAGVFTNDLNKAFYAFEHCEVGGVVINDVPSVRVDSQPYGGVKDSGVGREGMKYAMEDFTELRVMLMKDAGKL
eukprot:gnl/Hemi2/2825_TR1006_c0_g1_i1.p1 gnl/Hemi2/2825_TR1006_c0_g1~~gnl/Hemi2/2825_TR1006_c0_g1_i1.p1  ORF type:complete len:521 (-),score=161.57 gnl/Hemi2/2825_TR1006_c0_g1_i1:211-1773(-)